MKQKRSFVPVFYPFTTRSSFWGSLKISWNRRQKAHGFITLKKHVNVCTPVTIIPNSRRKWTYMTAFKKGISASLVVSNGSPSPGGKASSTSLWSLAYSFGFLRRRLKRLLNTVEVVSDPAIIARTPSEIISESAGFTFSTSPSSILIKSQK